MSDWQVGDLAVRVETSCSGGHWGQNSEAPIGSVLRVVGLRRGPFCDCDAPLALLFEGGSERGGCCLAYRKIRPDEREACEPEFVTLLQRIKRKVAA